MGEGHQRCQWLPGELGLEQGAGALRGKQGISLAVIRQRVHAETVSLPGGLHQAVEALQVLGGAHHHLLLLRQADVVTGLRFHARQQGFLFTFQADHHRTRRLDGLPCWR